uniref:Ribosomal protein S7 n=1 Tax=Babesia orientalis TaxID=273649 RepID=A0A0M3TGV1_9APIC|nr:ribosomal protein S7 [Babesia orientalis]ALE29363.1 ribosomal protein S7 [Babesia orientalis]
MNYLTNYNKNNLKKELILNLFTNFIQKKGKHTQAKKLLVNISSKIREMSGLKLSFVSILEYIIYKLNLPLIMITNKLDQFKYYFLVMSTIKYIKKFIFAFFLKLVRAKNKLPFRYNFIIELYNILKDVSPLTDHKNNVLNVFEDTNSYIKTNINDKYKNLIIRNNFMYVNYKLKYLNRYINNNNFYSYVKNYTNINKTNSKNNNNNIYNNKTKIKNNIPYIN